jgi:hypothetical protein
MSKLHSEHVRIWRLPYGALAFLFVTVLTSPVGSAQNMIVYPAKGQSQELQDRDRYECHNWAVGQTGFDPTRPTATAPPPAQAPQGGMIRGATRGAAVGAVGGAIGGNAGKGAAIGAATGAMLGGMRRADQQRQQAAAQAQQNSATSAQRDSYNRALRTCLQGRGYTVN